MDLVGLDRQQMNDLVTEWMRQYADAILRLCLVNLSDYQLAEDAMQETFVKAYHAFPRFRGDSSLETWLYRIAINACKDQRGSAWMRFTRRDLRLSDLPEPESPPVESDDTLIESVMRLPAKQKEAILLHYYAGLPVSEVPQALKISVPAVYKRLNKAQQTLKVALEEWYHDA